MLEVVNGRSTGKVWFGLRVDFKRVEKCSLPLFGRVDCCLFSSLLLFGHLLTFFCDLLLFPSFLVILWPFKNRVPTITLLKAFLLRSVLQVHLHFFVFSCLIDFSFYCVLTASSSYLIESCLIQMWLRRSNSAHWEEDITRWFIVTLDRNPQGQSRLSLSNSIGGCEKEKTDDGAQRMHF